MEKQNNQNFENEEFDLIFHPVSNCYVKEVKSIFKECARILKKGGILFADNVLFRGFVDGRVKTLHPKIHAGVLAIRDNSEHMKQLEELGVDTIDVVAINLYPFKQTILKEGTTLEEAIENIDIGGPTMIRAAAKNWQDVAVIVDPADYATVIEEYKANGAPSKETKFKLAGKVFEHTANYDSMINTYLRKQRGEDPFANCFTMTFEKVQDMRYGENPHQKAAFYTEVGAADNVLSAAKQLHGKELSYNNINDANGALDIIKEFGADLLRLWAGSSDYHVDVRCSDNIFKQLSQSYLKFRNTARYCLGNLDGFDPNNLVSADEMEAFSSPNFPPLATAAIDIRYIDALIREKENNLNVVDFAEDLPIAVLKIFPGIQFKMFENIMTENLKALVIEAFGVGNIPQYDAELLPLISKAANNGTIIVVCTQCLRGKVQLGTYETSSALKKAGAVSGGDMTVEAAVTKLRYLFAKRCSSQRIKSLMEKDLRGELSE